MISSKDLRTVEKVERGGGEGEERKVVRVEIIVLRVVRLSRRVRMVVRRGSSGGGE